MAAKPRNKMPVSERAKQFMPFAALRGLNEALAEKERELERVKKTELTDDKKEELNRLLSALRSGDSITLTKYENGFYRTVQCKVTGLDSNKRILCTDSGETAFDDISELIPG